MQIAIRSSLGLGSAISMQLFALALLHNIFVPLAFLHNICVPHAFLHNSFVPLAFHITAPSAAADPFDREMANEGIRARLCVLA